MEYKELKLNQTQIRYSWIDILRAFGIVAVIMCHTSFPGLQKFFAGPFEVTIFFFISGYLSVKNEYPKLGCFLKKKIKSLLVPYLFFSVIWIIYDLFFLLVDGNFSVKKVLLVVISYLIQIRMKPIWFLACLFFSEILVYFILKITNNNLLALTIISVTIIVASFIYYTYIKKPLPWNVDLCLVSIPLMLIGAIVKKENIIEKIIKYNKIFLVFISFVFMLFAVLINYINVNVFNLLLGIDLFSNSFGNYFMFSISAILSIFSLLFLSIAFEKNKIFEYIGKNSLVIFALHSMPIAVLDRVIGYKNNVFGFKSFLIMIIVFIVSLSISSLINELITKTKMKVLIGK